MEIEKSILFKVHQQFPAIYRENGEELVQLVKDYYEFLETETNMSHYNSRRLFEYRDISTTTTEFIVQFHKAFMPDLDLLDPSVTRFVVKNILDLYRRKGTPGSIKLFFRMFYNENAQVTFPGKWMSKPSDSSWRRGIYLELEPNNKIFYDADDNEYDYGDLYGRNIRGAKSGARAAVDTVSFLVINKTLVPVLYLSDVKGTFQKYDTVVSIINGNAVGFGRVSGSLSNLNITTDPNIFSGTTDHEVGEIFEVESEFGSGGKAIVTEVFSTATGQVSYTVEDGGFGYTTSNTEILVSDQVLIIDNPNKVFTLEERIIDDVGNTGRVIGQSQVAVGLKMDSGETMAITNRPFMTLDRDTNVDIEVLLSANVTLITDKNNSSPGDLYPFTVDDEDVTVTLKNEETVSLITDKIGDFTSVTINSSNYNTVPPALKAMSGTADPVTLATPLEDAFDLTPFTIGTIDTLVNINPGADYTNDVWTLARDPLMSAFDRYEQIITMEVMAAAFSLGEEVEGSDSGRKGVITEINTTNSFIKIRPFSYYGFTKDDDIIFKGTTYSVLNVARDYNSDRLGENADIKSDVDYQSGKIKSADVYRSGLGYPEGDIVFLVDEDGTKHARAVANSFTEGITEGYWATFNSHLNGYVDSDGDGTVETTDYKQYGMRIQDSDYYQEFSYEVKSLIGFERYKEALEKHVHLAGTKMFGEFLYERDVNIGIGSRMTLAIYEDEEVGGDPVVGPDRVVPGAGGGLRVDTRDISVDEDDIAVDATLSP